MMKPSGGALSLSASTFTRSSSETMARKAGVANGHKVLNYSDKPATYLEIGTRLDEETANYPDVDLVGVKTGGKFSFTRKDGSPV